MAKRRKKKGQNRQKGQNGAGNATPISEAQICSIREWLDRMETHLGKAITLSEKMSEEKLNDDDNFWALVKYAENVQECAVQLDNLKHSILEALEEVPIKSEQGTELNWSGLKGMRNRLAHNFWDVDHEILWDTVTKDFPVLRTLLSLLIVAKWSADPDSWQFSFKVRKFRELPLFRPGDEFTLGNSVILMSFNKKGRARCMRIARVSDQKIQVKPPDDVIVYELSLSLDDGEQREHLGHFVNMRVR